MSLLTKTSFYLAWNVEIIIKTTGIHYYLALCGPTLACSNDDEAWIWLSPIMPDSMPRGPMQVAEMKTTFNTTFTNERRVSTSRNQID